MNPTIRLFQTNDWNIVAETHRQGLQTRNATLETHVPDFDIWIKKSPRSPKAGVGSRTQRSSCWLGLG